MRRILACSIVALVACTEPEPPTFQGVIIQKFVVIDVFSETKDVSITVDKNVGSTGQSTCADRASVHILPTTKIAWSDAPDQSLSADELEPGQVVKVLPPSDPRDICPMKIEATSVIIVR